MHFSEVDASKSITTEKWAVSLLVTNTQTLGHTLVAVEGAVGAERFSLVADLVPLIRNRGGERATKFQLMIGEMKNKTIEGQIKIKTGKTVKEKVGSRFSYKTWLVPRADACKMIDRIESDAINTSHDVERSAYLFRLFGQLTELTEETVGGVNCANWSQKMLREAGITDQGGLILDFPLTQTLPGTRTAWLCGLMLAIAAAGHIRSSL